MCSSRSVDYVRMANCGTCGTLPRKCQSGVNIYTYEANCMLDIYIVLITFIVSSSLKSLLPYLEIELDQRMLLIHVFSTLGFSAILVFLTLKCKRRLWFILWYFLHALFLFVNINFFEFFGRFLHLNSVYLLIPEALTLMKNFDIPLDIGDLIFIIDFPLFIYLLQRHKNIKIPAHQFKMILTPIVGMTVIASFLLCTVPIIHNSALTANMEDRDLIARYGFVGHNFIDLSVINRDSSLDAIKYGNPITDQSTPGHRPNIILIQFESLDANIVNYRYGGEYVTPFLHKLTHNSLYFPFTLCYRKLGGTSDCEIAVNNSIEPPLDVALMAKEHYHYPNSVVKVLKKNGYITEAFHGNSGWFYKRRSAYSAMGYDNFFDPGLMDLSPKGWGVPDQDVMNYAVEYLKKLKTPFFASIITMTSHEPFNLKHFVPDHRFDGVTPELTRHYFASVAYSDRVVGGFITDIQRKYPDTYIFLYGDHTPYVINDGPFRRSVLRKEEAMEMVPLFIITPNGQRHFEHHAVASYLDFAPTILHVAGGPYSYRSLGVDLLKNMSLHEPVIYRKQLYNRAVLYKEMSETYKDMWN